MLEGEGLQELGRYRGDSKYLLTQNFSCFSPVYISSLYLFFVEGNLFMDVIFNGCRFVVLFLFIMNLAYHVVDCMFL